MSSEGDPQNIQKGLGNSCGRIGTTRKPGHNVSNFLESEDQLVKVVRKVACSSDGVVVIKMHTYSNYDNNDNSIRDLAPHRS